MPILRRVLAVSAVAAASTITFALPASAHTGMFQRDCDKVTVNLTAFARGENTVHVFRNGTEIDKVTFDGPGTTKTYDESNEGTVTYKVQWFKGETSDGHAAENHKTLYAPKDCEPEPTPTPTPTEKPTEPTPTPTAVEPTGTTAPSEAPSPSETPEAPTAAPSSSAAAVQGAKLANTGASNTVPMVIIGAVLVAGGAGLTFFTRRRRSASSAS